MTEKTRTLCVVTSPGFDPDDPELRPLFEQADVDVSFRPHLGGRSRDELVDIMRGASAVVASTDPFDATVLERLALLRVIARTGVGLDSIDLEAATRSGVVVTRTSGAHEETVADHALALMLAAVRRVVENDASVRSGRWEQARAFTAPELHGSCVGIVGVGRIGKAVARRLEGFECEILGFDPYVASAPGISLVALEELFERADVVSLHAPLSPQTSAIVDVRLLRRMRPGAILVNTARGKLVDEAALVEALTSGSLGAAALDVFVDEPPRTPSLLELPNVVLSPHVAGLSSKSVRELSRQAVTSALDVLAGRPNAGIVNPEALTHERQKLAQ